MHSKISLSLHQNCPKAQEQVISYACLASTLSTGNKETVTYLTQLRVLDNSPIATKFLHTKMAQHPSKP
jgi:hypothetical protein